MPVKLENVTSHVHQSGLENRLFISFFMAIMKPTRDAGQLSSKLVA
jgi:hypothetical protein